jgi:two-component system sensor histidine kinase SenX3
VDSTTAAVLGGAVGLLIGALAVTMVAWTDRARRRVPDDELPEARVPEGVADVLAVLGSSAIVLDRDDAVVRTSPSAVAHGLVRDSELVHPALRDLARRVRRDGEIREAELELSRGPIGTGVITVAARIAPLGSAYVLLLVEDRTHARRLEEVRRDFVANVSHELKTPVGGLALLAEAVQGASDDPEAVTRFASRMQVESSRLTTLVTEIVELSRLQVADTLHDPELVDVGQAAAEAVDHTELLAQDRGTKVTLVREDPGSPHVFGDSHLLTTAIRNLVANAITYSDPGTSVTLAVRTRGELVEVAVTDQGHGIPASEQPRIFERFYRVDQSRASSTGGTGLGLAIVKHVCANHGGDVTVWSEEGHGSTFTMRLPAAHRPSRPGPDLRVATRGDSMTTPHEGHPA